jgi:hypothetical protein
MTRRLAVLLLSTAVMLTGVVAAPCASHAACAMAQAGPMDCCAGKTGISAPSCCDGKAQLSRKATPATAERSAQMTLDLPGTLLPTLTPVVVAATRIDAPPRADARAAPPGGTLIAQHTSLLL